MRFDSLRGLVRSCVALALVIQAPGVSAAESLYEVEPNNTPQDAIPISGSVTLLGALPGNDQDGYLWTVTDDDARKRWTFELHGVPGALTIAEVVRLEHAESGQDVVGMDRLMKMGTRDGLTPSIAEDLLFEPGEYLIGIAGAGGPSRQSAAPFRPPTAGLSFGDDGVPDNEIDAQAATQAAAETDPEGYRFLIREGSALVVKAGATDQGSREASLGLRPGREHAAFAASESAWYAFDFTDVDLTQRWDIDVQVPVGRVVEAALLDASGESLAEGRSDPRGRVGFPDLSPGVGTYYVRIETTARDGFIRAVGSEAAGQRVSGEEAEPNGRWELANRIDLGQSLAGRIGERGETDFFVFVPTAEQADQLQTLRLESVESGQPIEFCLLGADGARVQCRRDTTPVELPDLVLAERSWGLSVSRADEGLEYRIGLTAQGSIEPDREAEPNDTVEFASSVPSKNRIQGRISGEEVDFFRFVVTSEPQLWRFQVLGGDLDEVTYQDRSGRSSLTVKPQRGEKRVRLDNVFLMPGEHYLKIRGSKGGDYTVLARALGRPDDNAEREPNDDPSSMQRLAMGQTRSGLLAEPSDQDLYRFFLANHDHIRLTLQPPPDGVVEPELYWYDTSLGVAKTGRAGEAITLSGVFPPGDYRVVLEPKQVSDAEYALSLERLPRFSCLADCEPTGMKDLYRTARLPADGVLEGRAGDWRDVDTYQLPRFELPTPLAIFSDSKTRISMGLNRSQDEPLKWDPDTGSYRTTVPAGGPYQLVVDSRGEDYRLQVEISGMPAAPRPGPLPAELTIDLGNGVVSAYRTSGQRLEGHIELANTSQSRLDARLEAVSSDYRWQVVLEQSDVGLEPGDRVRLPFAVVAPPDAWADRVVRISARAVDGRGSQVEAWQEVFVDRDVAPVAPVFGWAIPDALRGGFNVAASRFGSRFTDDQPKGANYELLLDDLVFATYRSNCCGEAYGWAGDDRPALTIELAGERPVPVVGVALNHFGTTNVLSNVREGTLLLSDDGVSFREALRFESLPVSTEQYFALPAPVPARFARLRFDSTFNFRPGVGGVTLGEWKVVAAPGFDLSNGAGFNLADPALGGHLVSDSPPAFYAPSGILDPADDGSRSRLRSGENQEYVIGFHHNRAASIRRVQWHYGERARDAARFERVLISVSTESPVGPWRAVGEMDPREEDTVNLDLPAPVWARFVKLTAIPGAGDRVVAVPASIRIYEAPTNDAYRSVLTEWGHASTRAFYESEQGLRQDAELAVSGNESRARAAVLVPGRAASGQVALARQEHWYRLRLPDGHNTLRLTVTGEPTVRTMVALETADGEQVPLKKYPHESTPVAHLFAAGVEPGTEVYLRVTEPPRNVVFTWDTSASVTAFLPTIYNALSAFAGEVVPGQEAVNLMPFNAGALLKDWYGEPYILQTILNDYPRGTSSSSAEQTISESTRLLAPRAGAKSIVVITDGITVHHGPMWREMRAVQPRVFGIGVGGSEAWNVDVFQDWASVNGGHYQHLIYDGEMEVAFDRAATLMRRPADYALLADSSYQEAPGPGLLSVSSGSAASTGGVAGRAAVELILDASGSMLQRLQGKQRIVMAKEVLTEAVTTHIPAGTPVAIRVFGHKEPDACRTDLEMPLAPLDPTAAAIKIGAIQAMNLARTPIAESLAAVAGDLRGASGRTVILLVTDGEETCDGDPAAAIESLQARGMDVSLNIVGFAIDNPTLADQFRTWAELGDGRYFGASDQAGLSDAIRDALKVPFSVFDRRGDLVAEGLVDGEPLELEAGDYRVVVQDGSSTTFDDVEVASEQTRKLEL